MKITAPKFIQRMVPELIWGMEDDERVFLTFDDGPTPGITEYILQQLDKYNAKATFFCL
ncbi:MAG: polysaccharide deacetylase family protein, partial [Tidjanibacter sp.]|nr:polysaccharide deacetylase family protein [Tidjanibacter sp.]